MGQQPYYRVQNAQEDSSGFELQKCNLHVGKTGIEAKRSLTAIRTPDA